MRALETTRVPNPLEQQVTDEPPADWYADPTDPTQLRYWDGQSWTEHRAPAARPPTGSATWPAATTAPGTAPDPWLWQSIVATLLCCLPLGVAGIVFAARSSSAWSVGDVAGARQAADTARKLTLWSVGLALGGIVLWLLFALLGLMAV